MTETKSFVSPVDYPQSPLARKFRQPLLIGLFLPLQAGGWSPSTLARTTSWEFDYNMDLTLRAEHFGLDLVFGLAQWLPKGGYGGVLEGTTIDACITASALAAVTRKILLISTIHILYGWHPLHLAKFGATLDHISKGRWGVNIVTGHRNVEYDMFGLKRTEHDKRYDLAGEFFDIAEHLWTEKDNYTWAGEHWSLKNSFVTPKSDFGRPILVAASGSDAGVDFAARHADLLFVRSPVGNNFGETLQAVPDYMAGIKNGAAARGRKLRTLMPISIVSRDTEDEAWAHYDAIVDYADEDAINGMHNQDSDSHRKRVIRKSRGKHPAVSPMVQLVGSPEQVAKQIIDLHEAGVDGIQLTFFDFKPDLEYFGNRILPLLKEAGLRIDLD